MGIDYKLQRNTMKYILFFISILGIRFAHDLKELDIKCQNNDSKSCIDLATYYATDSKDREKELHYAKFACDNTNSDKKFQASGCYGAGVFYKEKFFNTNNKEIENKAKFYLKKACKLDYELACNSLKLF